MELDPLTKTVVVYRLPFTWSQKKHIWKLVHAGLMLLALVLSVLGLCAVFDFHRGIQAPHLYSLHSWVGICTVVLFAVQWVLGLGGFLLPCSPLWIRSSLKPVHSWMGKAILILSVTACISGITEKLLFTLNGDSTEPYSSLPAEAKFVNSLGLLIVAFGLVTFGILSNKKWQRPEEDAESVQVSMDAIAGTVLLLISADDRFCLFQYFNSLGVIVITASAQCTQPMRTLGARQGDVIVPQRAVSTQAFITDGWRL
ncbi:cytochrome b ascorbate-dependent protein 3-like isoform X2 [Acanthopagrus latus]|uniref:cytochrome b ascorbate-dependent protein 3-like isoform X2 n=1 Tax=Acanthopagrus latus TaxID=8177 RepID=UPI00187BED94|nr:cytochrome b ascorbate-dependent protein 3-like isoform X2 [Acanthopagrus latus]